MDLSFMESVWWVFKQLFDKGLIYKGFKVRNAVHGWETWGLKMREAEIVKLGGGGIMGPPSSLLTASILCPHFVSFCQLCNFSRS